MKKQTPIWLTIAISNDSKFAFSQRLYYEEKLREEMADLFDKEYGSGNWLIIPTADLPGGFDPVDYMVVDGRLVPATEEILAERKQYEEDMTLRIERDELLRKLADTDYKALKFAEGSLSEADFAPIRTERQVWRERINEIETKTE